MEKISYSRSETFKQCKFKFKLSYVDELKAIESNEANNPLKLGKSLHKGIETTAKEGIQEYIDSYSLMSDLHINEIIKLEFWINKIKEILPEGKHEIPIENEEYRGYIDYVDNDNNLYDFKYSNNVNGYLDSAQLHIYKYFYEKIYKKKINKLFYVFIPKVMIRQKKDENIQQFRIRLKETLITKEIQIIEIKYNESKVNEFLNIITEIHDIKEFPKEENRYCDFCEFYDFCKKGENYMLLPKNERRDVKTINKKTIWIYGTPFSGKTTFANNFPDPIMLNTDGNIKFVDAPYIAIKDVVNMDGRIKRVKLSWEIFKETIDELEKKENTFKTIIVDLLEDLYEHCRLYMYKQLGITHESDDSFRAWDKVRIEFLSTIKRLMNLDYENIILISHEDATKDITKRTGDKFTSIKPNLQDKVAIKIAGMVDIVGRVIVEDKKHLLSFENDETTFGGGRLNIRAKNIMLNYDEFIKIYEKGEN